MAAGMAQPGRRASVVGTLLGGLIGGILLARAFGGLLGGWLGWRAPYLVAAALALLLAAVLPAVLGPALTAPPSRQRYLALLAAPVRLWVAEPELRRSCLYQACLFGGFTAAWTSLALLVTGPRYGLGTPAVGLIALVAAGSVIGTPAAGRWVDRRGPDPVNLVCMVGVLAAAGVLVAGGTGGTAGLVALAAGMLLLDVAVQCGQVANQARIFAVKPEARSRLNTAYMTCAFLGGAVGSWLGVRVYTYLGWFGVAGLVVVAASLALVRHVLRRRALANWWPPPPRDPARTRKPGRGGAAASGSPDPRW
jgi:predicted MFS family arabinose efflux permease